MNSNGKICDKLNLHEGHRERLRTRLGDTKFVGADDYQVLEYMLTLVVKRRDTNELAHTLINKFGSLAGVFEAPVYELEKIKGVSHTMAFFLNSIPYIFRNYKESKKEPKFRIITPLDAYNYLGSSITHLKNEQLYMICLDNANKVINSKNIASGSLTQVNIDVKDCNQYAISSNASKVILLHNHPHGEAEPSVEDDIVTKQLLVSFESLGIELYDHVIVNYNENYYSYHNEGKLNQYRQECRDILKLFKN